ncbi:hypothetical protein V6N13_018103 [Hibiscus sabdariffa]|uniref:Uncharacterized protein n=1 Tax=Hibiscus sabdariffa TaxID=183260 RepID=A0ABR2CGE4_9ROSI
MVFIGGVALAAGVRELLRIVVEASTTAAMYHGNLKEPKLVRNCCKSQLVECDDQKLKKLLERFHHHHRIMQTQPKLITLKLNVKNHTGIYPLLFSSSNLKRNGFRVLEGALYNYT